MFKIAILLVLFVHSISFAEESDSYKNCVNSVKNKKYKEALKICEMAIEIDSKCAECHFRIYEANRGLNNNEEAIKNISKSINLYPHPDMYVERAITYGVIGEYHKTIEDTTNAIELIEKNDSNEKEKLKYYLAYAYYYRGLGYSFLKQYNSAIENYDKALDLKYENIAQIYSYRGIALFYNNNKEKAEEDLEKAIKLNANISDVTQFMALIC